MNEAIVLEADLELRPETDVRAPGGTVTAELCGHWEHEGACRWPHNSEIDVDGDPARLRTIVLARDDRDEVVRRVEHALRSDNRWHLVRFEARGITDGERPLAKRLAQS